MCPLVNDGNFMKREPKPGNVGIVQYTKQVDKAVDPALTDADLVKQMAGLADIREP